ncbi:MAG TPA: diaminopimelate epimerase [Candidatus Borkfalkia excrementigallinarum]|uniref:Diaminopimelate epimerase n=1 Tax=Candidatus Borkfalkia excrementigallinarum TaxID=2838506 RepID=A0A9D2CRI4_9FIRM|nr:diaminopimelate epimerase [Candidatus Borkfalkia excrementigallinarum]
MVRKFIKMEGAGNDYIYFDCLRAPLASPETLAVRLSDRHKGIGGDGIVLICPSGVADAKMRMFNADGSEGKMCGNAIRCVGKYLYESGAAAKENLEIETLSGVKKLRLYPEKGVVSRVRVDMGAAVFDAEKVPVLLPARQVIGYPVQIAGEMHRITCVSMGNPHCVVFEDPDALDIAQIGPKFENAPLFPERVNTEFIKKIGARALKMRVWERGSGETLACGTGACAAAAAAVAKGLFPRDEDIEVQLLGGTLTINVGDTVFMTGEAKTVFMGEVEL